MIKRFLLAAALAALPLASQAAVLPLIDFEGVGNGANVADYYNGGTDSYGNRGPNYGIHFDALVRYNADGAYVAGAASMSFAANILPLDPNEPYFVIEFLANRYDVDGGLSFIDGTGFSDATWVSGIGNPYCSTKQECDAINHHWIPRSRLHGYTMYSDGRATSVSFNTDRLDNVQFVSPPSDISLPATRPGSDALDRDIPEPASTLLFGIGALGLLAARRRK